MKAEDKRQKEQKGQEMRKAASKKTAGISSAKPAKAENTKKTASAAKSTKAETAKKAASTAKPAKAETAKKATNATKSAKAETAKKTASTAKSAKAETAKKAASTAKSVKPAKTANAAKPQKKGTGGKSSPAVSQKASKKPVNEIRSFLYLLPKKTAAKDLAKALDFLPTQDVEVWEEECVLEISAGGATVTFEDIRDSLEKADKEVLSALRMKQVIACDYESVNAQLVQRIMKSLLERFGGKIGSDTEDFTPFLDLEEL